MNSCAAICGLEAPALARRAISASCTDTPLAAQPLPVQQVGAAEFRVQRGAAEVVDGFAVARAGILAFTDQRARASLPLAGWTCLKGVPGAPLAALLMLPVGPRDAPRLVELRGPVEPLGQDRAFCGPH